MHGGGSSVCWAADVGMLWLLACCGLSSRRGLAAGMLSRWQAAPIWALLAKSGSADASASLQRISFLGTWLCCCMSDQLQNLPARPPDPPCCFQDSQGAQQSAPVLGTALWSRGDRGRSSVLWRWVSLMALCHLLSLQQPPRREVWAALQENTARGLTWLWEGGKNKVTAELMSRGVCPALAEPSRRGVKAAPE